MKQKVTLKFYLNTDRGTAGNRPLYAYININGSKLRRSTGISLNEKDFSESKQNCKDLTINAKLSEYQTDFNRIADDYFRKAKPLTAEIMFQHLLGNKSLDIKLLEFADDYITHAKETGRIQHSTWKSVMTFRTKLEKFMLIEYKSDIPIDSVDLSFIKKYDSYLNGLGLHRNTINSNHHKHLKTIINDAIKERLITATPYDNYPLKSIETKRDFLTEDEILKLEIKEFKSPKLSRCRDMFLFSCYTGLRYSDLSKLLMKNVNTDGSCLYFQSEKTDTVQSVPLPDKAKELINKYADCGERTVKGLVFPSISNQKLNDYLKLVGEACEINKPITHHIARHTYATRLLNRGVGLDVIKHAMGHKSVNTTRIYAKMQDSTINDRILNVLNNE